MHPDLFTVTIGGVDYIVHAYSFFYVCAVFMSLFIGWIWARRYDFPHSHIAMMLAAMTVGGLIGARIMHVFTNVSLYEQNQAHLFSLHMENFAISGGVIGSITLGSIVGITLKINLWKFADCMVIPLVIGIVFARIGCFLNGCCFGRVTDTIFGVQFPSLSQAHLYQLSHGIGSLFSVEKVHPTELYEMFAVIVGGIIAWYIMKKNQLHGIAIIVFGMWYATFRLINLHFRITPDSSSAPKWMYPVIYVVTIIICAYLYYTKSVAQRS